MKKSCVSPVCSCKAQAQESRVCSVSVAQEVVGCFAATRRVPLLTSIGDGYYGLVAQDICSGEETLRVAKRDKTQE